MSAGTGVILLLLRASAGYYARLAPLKLLAIVLALTLGSGVLYAVLRLNAATLESFAIAQRVLAGPATSRVQSDGGRLPLAWLDQVQRTRHEVLAPQIELRVTALAGPNELPLRLLGVDPFAELALGRTLLDGLGDGAFERALTVPSMVLDAALAAQLGVAVGDRLTLRHGPRTLAMEVLATTRFAGEQGSWPLAVSDLSHAARLSADARPTQVDLAIDPDAAAALASTLPPGLTLTPIGADRSALRELSRAFRTNLTALAVLTALVAALFAASALHGARLHRRAELTTLRNLGFDCVELWLTAEALLLTVAGVGIGLVLGHGLAQALSAALTTTLAELYGAQAAAAIGFNTPLAVITAASLASAMVLLPLWPRLHDDARLWASVAGTAATAGALLLGRGGLWMSFAALALLLAGLSILISIGGAALLALLARRQRDPLTVLALREASARLAHLRLPFAAMSLAVAAPIGLDLMVSSFRASLTEWLAAALPADHYIGADGAPLPEALVALTNGAATIHRSRLRFLEGRVWLLAFEGPPEALSQFPKLSAVEGADARWLRGEGVYVSEAYAARHGAALNQTTTLPGLTGRWIVLAVVQDYRTEAGAVFVHRSAYAERTGDSNITGIGVDLDDPLWPELEAQARQTPGVSISARKDVLAAALAVFERTFALTDALKLLCVLLASSGLAIALVNLKAEDQRNDELKRLLGFDRTMLNRAATWRAVWLALAAVIAAILLGTVLAVALTEVIHSQSFGWSFPLDISPRPYALGAFGALVGVLLAHSLLALTASTGPGRRE